jgi:hypothetical protein
LGSSVTDVYIVLTSMWSVSWSQDMCLQHRNARGYLCTKGRVFDTIVHKSFQRFHIYYISFTEAILIFSAWLTKELYNFDNIIFHIRLLILTDRGLGNSSGALMHG